MCNRIKKPSGEIPSDPKADETAALEWYEHKSRIMEKVMGKRHNVVMHAIFPYAIGGGLDLYYHPNGIAGTGIATMELSELPNQGSSNSVFSRYELVMFTKHPLALDDAKKTETSFGKAHANISSILERIARYSATDKLNPQDTCEFPAEMEQVGGKCLIFDDYGQLGKTPAIDFGILAVIEVFRSEMDFARKQSGEQLIRLLKEAGHYPYSDLERKPVA